MNNIDAPVALRAGSVDGCLPDWIPTLLDDAWKAVGFYRAEWQKFNPHREITDHAPAFEDWPVWRVPQIREQIAAHPPYGAPLYRAESLRDVAVIHSSTGTTGFPRVIPFCRSDESSLNEHYARSFLYMGVRADDVVGLTLSLATPAGGWSMVRGCAHVGATLVPFASGKATPPRLVVEMLGALGVTVMSGTPSYLKHIADVADSMGVDLSGLPVRLLVLAGEGAGPAARRELAERWGAATRSFYANTDVSWVAAECEAAGADHGASGLHLHTDVVHVEILDPSGRAVSPGEYGELVITSRARYSTPRVRFGTGDRTALATEPCVCGDPAPRMLPLDGRVDDALRFHGHTIWPASVENLLCDILGRSVEYFMTIGRHESSGREAILVTIEATEADLVTDVELADRLRDALDVRFAVARVGAGKLAGLTGVGQGDKVRRVRV